MRLFKQLQELVYASEKDQAVFDEAKQDLEHGRRKITEFMRDEVFKPVGLKAEQYALSFLVRREVGEEPVVVPRLCVSAKNEVAVIARLRKLEMSFKVRPDHLNSLSWIYIEAHEYYSYSEARQPRPLR